jgi:hypothetical protein
MGKLTKHHAKKLFPATEFFGLVVPIVSVNTASKDIIGSKLNQLSKDHLALIHGSNFPQMKIKVCSNRRQLKYSANLELSSLSKNLS